MTFISVISLLFLVSILTIILHEIFWVSVRAKRAVKAGRVTKPVSQSSDNEIARVLIIGDSTAYGTGAVDETRTIAGLIAKDHPGFTIVNEAENAMSIRRLNEKIKQLSDQKFDVVFVHVGGMDTLLFTRQSIIKKELESFFLRAEDKGVQMIVLVSVNNVGTAPMFRFPLSKLFEHRSRSMSQLCTMISERHTKVIHVPLFAEYVDDPLYEDGKWYFAPDGIHPNDHGYDIWYQQIRKKADPHLLTLYKRNGQ